MAKEINNTTESQREEYKTDGYEETHTNIGTTALIGGAGNLSINTTEDMNLKGSAIFANKDIYLDIGGDLNSVVVEDYTRTYTRMEEDGGMFGDDETREEETIKIRNISSYITSTNGSINANATNMNLQNTHIDSQTGTNLIADNNINLTTALDYDFHSLSESKDNKWTGGSIDIDSTAKGVNKGNNINSNGTINIVAGGDINSISTIFKTQEEGNINLLAGYKVDEEGAIEKSGKAGKVNLLTAQDFEDTYSYHEKYGGLFEMINPMNLDIDISLKGISISASYEKTSDENSTNTKTAVVNELASVDGLNIRATGDILSIGSQIQANGDINVKSDKNILLLSASNSKSEFDLCLCRCCGHARILCYCYKYQSLQLNPARV
jgi:filamentous hemagglutinin